MSKSEPKKEYPEEFLALCRSVESKRPRTVIDHILKHGSITSQELTDLYGYQHPPRAVRDVRECGIPIKTTMETIDGQRMARYTFEDPSRVKVRSRLQGRSRFAADLRKRLIEEHGAYDYLYLVKCDPKDLQIDHRIPFEIGGEGDEAEGDSRYMLLSASANRLKSHACENCENWNKRDPEMCRRCFWAYPEDYDHIAGREERLIMLLLEDKQDIRQWDELKEAVGEEDALDYLKEAIRRWRGVK